jgi:23S rRNA pseudouridine2605 synthase
MEEHLSKIRLNKLIAQRTGLSRRTADLAIAEHRVRVNGSIAGTGTMVHDTDAVSVDGIPLPAALPLQTILLNKPRGYVVSRDGQGSKTVYDLLPAELHHLKPVGRLDKDSSGLLLLTNDGALAETLTHPRYNKQKIYEIALDADLAPLHRQMIAEFGIQLEDGPSKMHLERITDGDEKAWRVMLSEGRNRQIRRTFESLGYTVKTLHRVQFGPHALPRDLAKGGYVLVAS